MYKTITTTADQLDRIDWATLIPRPMVDELKKCMTIILYRVTKKKIESLSYVVFDDDTSCHHIYFIESKYPRKGHGKKLVELVGKSIRLMPIDTNAEDFFLHLQEEGIITSLIFDRGAEDD